MFRLVLITREYNIKYLTIDRLAIIKCKIAVKVMNA